MHEGRDAAEQKLSGGGARMQAGAGKPSLAWYCNPWWFVRFLIFLLRRWARHEHNLCTACELLLCPFSPSCACYPPRTHLSHQQPGHAQSQKTTQHVHACRGCRGEYLCQHCSVARMMTEFLISRRKPTPDDERRLRLWRDKLEQSNAQIIKLGPLPKEKDVAVGEITQAHCK